MPRGERHPRSSLWKLLCEDRRVSRLFRTREGHFPSGSATHAPPAAITTFGDYVIHTFTSSGTFEVRASALTRWMRWWWERRRRRCRGPNAIWRRRSGGGRVLSAVGMDMLQRRVTTSQSATVEAAKSFRLLAPLTVARASFTASLHLAVVAPSWYRTTMVELVDLEILVETVADMVQYTGGHTSCSTSCDARRRWRRCRVQRW